MSATVAVHRGRFEIHGWAAYCTQGSRCCCLRDTTRGLSDEEALWSALSAWTTLQPRAAKPRQEPGRILCPNQFSDIIEKYWDYLHFLDQHLDFSSQSPYSQYHMALFSQALSNMNLDNFEPRPAAKAKQADIETSEDAAISRLRPIQDGLDDFQEPRSSADTGLGVIAPG
jgi:hypothetical protein